MKFETVERDEESLTTKVPRIWFFDSLAIYSLFPDTRKCFDMIFVYGIRMPPTRNRLPQEPPQREDL
jgi:hypothetical protein